MKRWTSRKPPTRSASSGRWLGSLAILLVLAALVATSCATVDRTVLAPPENEGATFVGNRVCADCHTNITRVYAASPHGRHYRDDVRWAARTGCESCHGPGSRHAAAGGRQLIVNPRQDPATCLDCHLDVRAEFDLPHRHPVPEARLTCVDCHDPHGSDIRKPAAGLGMARVNESCAHCHQEQARPFVFEHQAMREGCTSCHEPHGSINRSLLLDRGANLCLRCHAQMQTTTGQIVIGKSDHTANLRLGTCYSAGCHAAVHGSNVQPKLRY